MRLIPAAVICVAIGAFFGLGLDSYFTLSSLREHRELLTAAVQDNLLLGALGFLALYALLVAMSFPGASILSLVAGFLFGWVLGSVLVVTGATLGAVARVPGRSNCLAGPCLGPGRRLAAASGGRVPRERLQLSAVPAPVAGRAVLALNLAPALLGMRTLPFTLATAIGIIPGHGRVCRRRQRVGRVVGPGGGLGPGLGDPAVGSVGAVARLSALSLLPVALKHFRPKQTKRRLPVTRTGGTDMLRPDLCVIGGGSAGLSVAAGASQMGASTVLVERGAMGGDCLNTGCVPSKALLAAAKAAQGIRTAGRFGVHMAVNRSSISRPSTTMSAASSTPSPRSIRKNVSKGWGLRSFATTPGSCLPMKWRPAGSQRSLRVASSWPPGRRPVVPPIPGIDTVQVLTNESRVRLTACPSHLIVIGGGPIGCEMSQAFRRLGAMVTLLERDDHSAEGRPGSGRRGAPIPGGRRHRTLHEHADVRSIKGKWSRRRRHRRIVLRTRVGPDQRVVGSHVLVAAGRRPTTDGLDLDRAGIDHGPKGIGVDAGLRTTNRRVFCHRRCHRRLSVHPYGRISCRHRHSPGAVSACRRRSMIGRFPGSPILIRNWPRSA